MSERKQKYRVLIVDDEVEILNSLHRALKFNYDVVTCGDSTKVMTLLKKERIDCILMDIKMPEINGIELSKEIKFTYPHLPIIIMTGHGDENDAIQALKYGISAYIKKPINIYLLFDEIKRVIKSTKEQEEKQTKILLVDDDKALLKSLSQAFKLLPYDVTTCDSGEKALTLLKSHHYDILITDTKMPKMNGLQLIQHAKKTNEFIICIIITGVSTQDMAINSIKLGAFDYLRKPFKIEDLVSSIERSVYKLKINREIYQKNQLLLKKSESLEKLNNEITLQKNYLENIVESISNILLITDENGNIHRANDFATEKLGYTTQEICEKHISEILSMDNTDDFLVKLIKKQNIQNLEIEFIKKDTEKLPVILSVSLIKSHEKNIDGFIFVAQDISERKKNEEALYRLSYYDVLTGLPNRTYFESHVKHEMANANENNNQIAFLLMDLDGFKSVNDILGHKSGDDLLKKVAARLQSAFRPSDFIARIGGDEFIACLTPVEEKVHVSSICQRLIKLINQPMYVENGEVCVGISIGVVFFPDAITDYSQILKNADIALYNAKQNGRNQFQFFSSALQDTFGQQLEIENALSFALDRHEFHLVYQPIYDLTNNKIASLEALIRWKSKDLGIIPPDVFIPIAEFNGSIIPISYWTIENAIEQLALWHASDHKEIAVTLNVSARQLNDGERLIDFLKSQCQKKNIDHSKIKLELTETAIMQNTKESLRILNKLNTLGFYIVLDDFGQGFSSLSLISKVPISTLKIDKQFVQNIDNKKNKTIVSSIISLSKGLGLNIIAEGVETKEQLDYLVAKGCRFVQGYYFGKPERPDFFKDKF